MSQMRAIVDKLLTNVAIGYVPTGFVAHLIFPELKVKQKTGKIGKYGNNHLRVVNSVMGGKGKAPQISTKTYDTDSYEIENHGLHDVVTPDDYDNVEQPFDAEADTTKILQMHLMLGEEKGTADALTNESVITQYETLSGEAQFSDLVNSDPLGKFTAMANAILNGCGGVMNTLIMDKQVFNILKYHPQLFNRLGFNQKGPGAPSPLTMRQMCDALDVARILVPDVRYNTAAEDAAAVLAPVWGKHIIGLCSPDSAMIGQVSSGYRISKASDKRAKVYKSPVNNPPDSTQVLVTNNYDYALVDVTKTIYLLKDAIA